jgi:uncharacterized membrane protein YidH (DUF202 family)
MRNVSPRAPDVNCATLERRPRWAAIPAVLLPLLGLLILILATACGSGNGHSSRPDGGAFLVLAVGALVVALLLLNAVSKLMGQVFDLTMNLLKAVATVGFTVAVVVAAVILAVMAAASSP